MNSNTLTIQKRRYIKFAKIEKATVWVVAAFAVEEENGQIVHISEPRIVKIIAKTVAALTGKVSKVASLLLAAPKLIRAKLQSQITFAYNTILFGSQSAVLSWFGARPPTAVI